MRTLRTQFEILVITAVIALSVLATLNLAQHSSDFKSGLTTHLLGE